jgi:asparagine synthase (glutamine-hydrolysing)
MAHSLEIRVPFVDVELLRAVAPLVGSSTPLSKLDMARSPAKPLPGEVLYRPKSGFSVPVREWLLEEAGAGSSRNTERGLRGWARTVYAMQAGNA